MIERAPSLACLRFLRAIVSSPPAGAAAVSKSRCRRMHAHTESTVSSVWPLFRKALQAASTTSSRKIPTATKKAAPLANDKLLDIKHWSADEYLSALTAAKYRKRWATIVHLYKQSLVHDVPLNEWSFDLYCRAEAYQGNAALLRQLALDLVDSPASASTWRINTIIHGLVLCGDVATAIDTVGELLQLNSDKLDTSTFNVLLKGARLGSVDSDLLNQAEDMRAQVEVGKDIISYNTLISAYLKLGNRKKACTYLDRVLSNGLATESSFGPFIHDALQQHDWQEAQNWLQRMRDLEIPRSIKTYLPFLVSACKQSDWDKLSETLYTIFEEEKLLLNTAILNVLLHAILKQRDYERIPDLMACFDDTICPDESTAVAIRAHIRELEQAAHETVPDRVAASLLRSAESWEIPMATSMRGRDRFARQRDEIKAFIGEGDFRSAAVALNSVRRRGVRPPLSLLYAIFHGLVQKRRFKYAREIYAYMTTLPGQTSEKTHTSLFALLQGTGPQLEREVEQLLQACIVFDDRPGTQLYTAAAVKLYRDGQFFAAIRLLRNAVVASTGLLLDVVACLVLVQCYSKLKDIAGMIWCLEQMKSNKCILDTKARRRVRRMIDEVDEGEQGQDREGVQQALQLLSEVPAQGRTLERDVMRLAEGLAKHEKA